MIQGKATLGGRELEKNKSAIKFESKDARVLYETRYQKAISDQSILQASSGSEDYGHEVSGE